eukprot:5393926-Prymnesium_polylepis.1
MGRGVAAAPLEREGLLLLNDDKGRRRTVHLVSRAAQSSRDQCERAVRRVPVLQSLLGKGGRCRAIRQSMQS